MLNAWYELLWGSGGEQSEPHPKERTEVSRGGAQSRVSQKGGCAKMRKAIVFLTQGTQLCHEMLFPSGLFVR